MSAVIDVFPTRARGWGWVQHLEHGKLGGTDIQVEAGTTVAAPASGRLVVTTGISATDGRQHSTATIQLPDGRRVQVLELAAAAPSSRLVTQGDPIGKSSNLWPHFHGIDAHGSRVPIETFWANPTPAASTVAAIANTTIQQEDDMARLIAATDAGEYYYGDPKADKQRVVAGVGSWALLAGDSAIAIQNHEELEAICNENGWAITDIVNPQIQHPGRSFVSGRSFAISVYKRRAEQRDFAALVSSR